jgi:hypothetical protein
LQPQQIAMLRQWIREGANWEDHWAFVAPKPQALPNVKRAAWPRQPLDRFILARLEKEGISPASEAEREALLRRVSFDLTGLPQRRKRFRLFSPIPHRTLTRSKSIAYLSHHTMENGGQACRSHGEPVTSMRRCCIYLGSIIASSIFPSKAWIRNSPASNPLECSRRCWRELSDLSAVLMRWLGSLGLPIDCTCRPRSTFVQWFWSRSSASGS